MAGGQGLCSRVLAGAVLALPASEAGVRVCACVCVSVKGRAAGRGMWDYVSGGGGLLWLHVGVGACSHRGAGLPRSGP